MAEETQEKIGFFRRVIMSIKDFEIYQYFASEKLSVAISYLLKIICIFAIGISILFTYKFSISLNNAINYFVNDMPELSYKDGNLTVNSDKPIIIENPNELFGMIIIDTNATQEQETEYKEKIGRYDNGIVFLKNKIVLKNTLLSQNMEYNYAEIANNYQIGEFTKQDITNYIATANMTSLYIGFGLTLFIYMYMIYLASTVVDVMILAVLGFVIARISGMRMRFKANFNMGVYALTLPIILNLIYIIVNNLTGFTVTYFNWMYTTISYIYIIVAILIIKTDMINKQMELMKIVEEQQRVKEEIKRQEEKQKEAPKDEDKKEENESKKENKKRKDKNLPEEPEGSNA